MPGLIGIVSKTPLGDELASMSAQMPIGGHWLSREWRSDSDRCAMACFARDSDCTTTVTSDAGFTVAFDGELYGLSCKRGMQAAHLLHVFVNAGAQGLRELEGRFIAAIFEHSTGRLSLVTDKFASKPLYYAHSDGAFAFGTSISALRSCNTVPSFNRDGLVQFFTYGQLWNDDTFYDSLKSCYSASEIVFDAETNTVDRRQYWRPSPVHRVSDQQSLDRMTDALSKSVADQTVDDEGLGVALSGGLDARTMLAFVDTERVQPNCVSLGMEGSLDQRSAKQLAELAGCPFHSLILGQGFLEGFREHLERMVKLTDGHYLDQCIVMPTFPLYESLGIRTLLRGHVGELLHMHKAYNFSVDASFQHGFSADGLHQWLSDRLQTHLTAGVSETLFEGMEADEFRERGESTLKKGLAATEQFDHPLDRISQLFLDQRTRRETAMSLAKFNSVVDTRTPYLNGELIEAVFASRPELRCDETIQAHMLRTRRPLFLKPANSNTGAPVGVSRIHRTLAYYRMRVLAKLGVKGYQPYERLGLWLRQDLRPIVERILLDDRCLQRGLFNADCVRGVLRRNERGEANHTYLIMAMMIVELSLRGSNQLAPSSSAISATTSATS